MILQEILKEHPYLTEEDFSVYAQEEGQLIVLENAGVQKVIDHFKMKFSIVSHTMTPYNINHKGQVTAKVCASVHIRGRAYADKEQAFYGGKEVDTTGEAYHSNLKSDFNFPLGQAEQRARSKCARMIAGLYGGKIVSREEFFQKNSQRIDLKSGANIGVENSQQTISSIESKLQELEAKRSVPSGVADAPA